ncbi:MAG: hypothetical protein ACE1ZS_07060, partial [Candidatus Poribacteria bacterium]
GACFAGCGDLERSAPRHGARTIQSCQRPDAGKGRIAALVLTPENRALVIEAADPESLLALMKPKLSMEEVKSKK